MRRSRGRVIGLMKNCTMSADACPYDRIVAAARHLFATRGFHQTAMADLAAEANVSVGAIYRSFPSKAEIIRAIIASDTEESLIELKATYDDVAAGRISVADALERTVLGELNNNEQALSHEILAEGHRNPDVADTIGAFCGRYRAIFRDLVRLANPALSEEELDGACELLLACMFGFSHANLSRPCISREDTARMARRMILRSLGVSSED